MLREVINCDMSPFVYKSFSACVIASSYFPLHFIFRAKKKKCLVVGSCTCPNRLALHCFDMNINAVHVRLVKVMLISLCRGEESALSK